METASALEKLFPKQCQVLGIVTPGIVGERRADPLTPSWAPPTENHSWAEAHPYFFSARSTAKSVVFTTVSNWLVLVFFRLPWLALGVSGLSLPPCAAHVSRSRSWWGGWPCPPGQLPPCGRGELLRVLPGAPRRGASAPGGIQPCWLCLVAAQASSPRGLEARR